MGPTFIFLFVFRMEDCYVGAWLVSMLMMPCSAEFVTLEGRQSGQYVGSPALKID